MTIGRQRCPVRQAGQVITRQDGLGFTCHAHPDATPVRVPSPLQSASAVVGAVSLDG
ncbi:hypothetical protein RKD49_004209 [Streptomyces glaucescens]